MSTSSELPRIISFFAVEALLILLNIYFIVKLRHYYSYVRAGGTTLKFDWYLVASFVTLSLAIMLRSIINLVIYVEELTFEGSNKRPADVDDFNAWFKIYYPKTYTTVEILYLVVLGIRNTSIIINLARWAVINHGLESMCMT
jgi:hypothetical protein